MPQNHPLTLQKSQKVIGEVSWRKGEMLCLQGMMLTSNMAEVWPDWACEAEAFTC